VHVEQAAEEPVKEGEKGGEPAYAAAVSKSAHPNRRQSVQHGLNVASRLQQEVAAQGDDSKESSSGTEEDEDAYLSDRVSLMAKIVAASAKEDAESSSNSSMLETCEYLPRVQQGGSSGCVSSQMLLEALMSSRLASRVLEDIAEGDEDSSIYNPSTLSEESLRSWSEADLSAPSHVSTLPCAQPLNLAVSGAQSTALCATAAESSDDDDSTDDSVDDSDSWESDSDGGSDVVGVAPVRATSSSTSDSESGSGIESSASESS
jgi:hypothetical protein